MSICLSSNSSFPLARFQVFYHVFLCLTLPVDWDLDFNVWISFKTRILSISEANETPSLEGLWIECRLSLLHWYKWKHSFCSLRLVYFLPSHYWRISSPIDSNPGSLKLRLFSPQSWGNSTFSLDFPHSSVWVASVSGHQEQ